MAVSAYVPKETYKGGSHKVSVNGKQVELVPGAKGYDFEAAKPYLQSISQNDKQLASYLSDPTGYKPIANGAASGGAANTPAPGSGFTRATATPGSGFTRTPAAQPATPGSAYTPVTREVGANETAQHQLAGILQKDSPLMQLSRTQGMQYGNSRGLLNSSIAGGAAQNAMIQNATPLAQQDAQTYFQQGRANQDAGNQFALTKANHQHESSMLDKQQEFKAGQDAILRDYQAQQNEIERQFQGSQNEAERRSRTEELARQSATELMRQVSGMNATLTDSIAKIQAADIEHGNKQSMINNLIEMHYNNLSTTTAMADYDVVDGRVVYIAKGPSQTQANIPEKEPAPQFNWSGPYF